MRVLIQGPNLRDDSKGAFHVHAADCRDNRKYGSGGRLGGEDYPMEIDAECQTDCEAFVYDFAPSEHPDYKLGDWLFDFHFAPCCSDLPVSKD